MSTATRPSRARARARGLWAVPIVLAVVLLVALGVTLGHSQPRLTGTNSVPLRGQGVGMQPGEQLCQPQQLLPAGTGRLRMFGASDTPGRTPKTFVTIRRKGGGVIARTPGRWTNGLIDARIDPPVRRSVADANVCIRNTGDTTLVLTGILTKYGNVRFRGKRQDLALTMLWYAPKDKNWISELGAVIPRVGHARIGGAWAFWVASLLLLSALGLAITTALRENTR